MNVSFSAEDLAFRDEVREFFASRFTESLAKDFTNDDTFRDAQVSWQKMLWK